MHERERRSLRRYQGSARWYDWRNDFAQWLRGTSVAEERRKPIRRLGLQPGQRVLEVAVGTGTNLPLIVEHAGPTVRMVGLDLSPGMLAVCRRKMEKYHLYAHLVEGEALHLPFADDSFDAVLHHGGLAEFPDRKASIGEMFRVVRPSGRVVICDVGVPADGQISLVNRLLLLTQPEYRQAPPVELIPPEAKGVHLSWFSRGAWYMIEFEKPAP